MNTAEGEENRFRLKKDHLRGSQTISGTPKYGKRTVYFTCLPVRRLDLTTAGRWFIPPGIRAASSTGGNSAQTLISSVSCGHIPTSSQLRARMYLHFARMEWTNTATAIGMPVSRAMSSAVFTVVHS